MNAQLEKFYYDNQDELEKEFEIYVTEKEWGSGEDRIRITEDTFWEFVEEKLEATKEV